jgi:hypothetical protein
MGGLLIKVGAFLALITLAALFIRVVLIPVLFPKKKDDNNNEK